MAYPNTAELLLRLCWSFRRVLLQPQNAGILAPQPNDLARGYRHQVFVGSPEDHTECALCREEG